MVGTTGGGCFTRSGTVINIDSLTSVDVVANAACFALEKTRSCILCGETTLSYSRVLDLFGGFAMASRVATLSLLLSTRNTPFCWQGDIAERVVAISEGGICLKMGPHSSARSGRNIAARATGDMRANASLRLAPGISIRDTALLVHGDIATWAAE